MCDYQCTSVRFIKLSNGIESNRVIFPGIGMLYNALLISKEIACFNVTRQNGFVL